jgi:ketopantoate reductase
VDDLFNTEVVIQIIPRDKAEAMLKEAEIDLSAHLPSLPMGGNMMEPVEEVTYQSPDEAKDLARMRSQIFLELQAAGLELEVSEIYQAIVGRKRLRNCTIDETKQIWDCITNGKAEPDPNKRGSLRDRMLQMIGGV